LGGAHRDPAEMAQRLKTAVLAEVDTLQRLAVSELLEQRYQRLRRYGAYAA
jgi:acetyl-CoA carboxylase carboxyl transferase subunit alpha